MFVRPTPGQAAEWSWDQVLGGKAKSLHGLEAFGLVGSRSAQLRCPPANEQKGHFLVTA